MIEPSKIAQCFFETFDKSAVAIFRRWLSKQQATKWIIAADFALRDKSRPSDCFAFTIIPYDLVPEEFSKEVKKNLPKDIKKSKTLDSSGAAWLRSPRHFHILIPMSSERALYTNGPNTKTIDLIRETLDALVKKFIELERGEEKIKKLKKALSKSKAHAFNIGLFTDLTLLALYLAIVALILYREGVPEKIGWFCDRDSMTSFCDSVIWDLAVENFCGLSDLFQIERAGTMPIIAVPDRSSGKEEMWFDDYIRGPDWLAGTLAAWDRQANTIAGEQEKYLRIIEDVMAESENTVILPVYLDHMAVRVTRLEITRKP